jgi:type II restriction enzyme
MNRFKTIDLFAGIGSMRLGFEACGCENVFSSQALDKVIDKARVHLYKPIQIAEILYRDRTEGDIVLSDIDTYRTASRKWRDLICITFLGRTSTSSARYQDDLFNDNAIPPNVLSILGEENKLKNGIVEAYIYRI